jgi:DNA-binding PadR family transcriptional regulator
MAGERANGEHTMYELFILSLLMNGPKHGYLIAKIINDSNGPFAKVSSGRLYPLLAKLQQDGLIAAEASDDRQHGDRRQHTFIITDAGRQRFHQLMMDTTSNPGDYQRLFWFKLPVLNLLQPSERLYLLDHYLNYCQTLIFHYTNEMEEFAHQRTTIPTIEAEFGEGVLYVQRRCLNQWQLDFDRVREWRAREVARAEGLVDAPASLVN